MAQHNYLVQPIPPLCAHTPSISLESSLRQSRRSEIWIQAGAHSVRGTRRGGAVPQIYIRNVVPNLTVPPQGSLYCSKDRSTGR
eukprot:5049607-Pyramimonas_sp.AAC.1